MTTIWNIDSRFLNGSAFQRRRPHMYLLFICRVAVKGSSMKNEKQTTSMSSQQTPWLSVIVPIYNGEKYLHKCLSSISEQVYKDYEVILVDMVLRTEQPQYAKTLLRATRGLNMQGRQTAAHIKRDYTAYSFLWVNMLPFAIPMIIIWIKMLFQFCMRKLKRAAVTWFSLLTIKSIIICTKKYHPLKRPFLLMNKTLCKTSIRSCSAAFGTALILQGALWTSYITAVCLLHCLRSTAPKTYFGEMIWL